MIANFISGGALLGFLGILAKLIVDTLRKRRREQAEGDIAEGSVAPTLAEKNLSVLDAQLVVLEKANSAERASYERRIRALEDEVTQLTRERDESHRVVTALRSQVDELQLQLDAVKAQLSRIQPSHNGPPA